MSENNFWTDIDEQKFFMKFIKKTHSVLEWGSGNSTLYLQDRVKKLVSIEHNPLWYNDISNKVNKSVTYLLKEPNVPDWENQYSILLSDDNEESYEMKSFRTNFKSHDGGFEDFLDYILAPISLDMKFDNIFIDGRARVACAWISTLILKPKGRIFIHDFGPETRHPFYPYRIYYDLVNIFLEEIDHCKTMYCFKPKKI